MSCASIISCHVGYVLSNFHATSCSAACETSMWPLFNNGGDPTLEWDIRGHVKTNLYVGSWCEQHCWCLQQIFSLYVVVKFCVAIFLQKWQVDIRWNLSDWMHFVMWRNLSQFSVNSITFVEDCHILLQVDTLPWSYISQMLCSFSIVVKCILAARSSCHLTMLSGARCLQVVRVCSSTPHLTSELVASSLVLKCGTVIFCCSAFHPPGSVNEYQLRLGWQRQVWFIPLRMNAGCAGKTVRSLENACHTWAP